MYKIYTETLFVGKETIFLPVCHSTNTELNQLLKKQEKVFEGTVVITDSQTAGRGQVGNSWEAELGKNLTFSVLFYPSFLSSKDQFFLPIFTSLAIVEALKEYGCFSIKWPNDIYIENKKLGGILIENNLHGQVIEHSIVGIGLNINQEFFKEKKAVSLKMILQNDLSLEIVLKNILESLEQYYLVLKSGNQDFLKKRYLSYLYKYEQLHFFKIKEEIVEGIIKGIDENGKLIVQINGKLNSYGIKEISFL